MHLLWHQTLNALAFINWNENKIINFLYCLKLCNQNGYDFMQMANKGSIYRIPVHLSSYTCYHGTMIQSEMKWCNYYKCALFIMTGQGIFFSDTMIRSEMKWRNYYKFVRSFENEEYTIVVIFCVNFTLYHCITN